MTRRRKSAARLLMAILAMLPVPALAATTVPPCGVSLTSLSKASGAPGEELELRGSWGDSQGSKMPCLNKGNVNRLEVISWSHGVIHVRIPRGLGAGTYKVGVYCDLSGGSPYSSEWVDFEVTDDRAPMAEAWEPPAAPGPRAATPPPQPPAAARGRSWRDEFIAAWRARGREMARSRTWLASSRVLVLSDEGVNPSVIEKVAGSLGSELGELGAKKLRAERAELRLPADLGRCSNDAVLDVGCMEKTIQELRRGPGPYGRSILVVVTNSAIGLKPRKSPSGNGTIGPPAGQTFQREGWLLVSEFWRSWNRATIPNFETPANREWLRRFEGHSLDSTVRHELLHILGLPHHDGIANPGFPEARLCTQCTHKGSGSHETSPHAECGMTCGATDDDWFHIESFGKGFGFCEKCATAAKALVEGIEDR